MSDNIIWLQILYNWLYLPYLGPTLTAKTAPSQMWPKATGGVWDKMDFMTDC